MKLRTRILLAIPVVLLMLVGALYAWPLNSDALRSAPVAGWSFDEAQRQGQKVVAADESDTRVLPQCRSRLWTHGRRSAKAVLLLHGYTDCTKQLTDFAEYLYAQGYNVYLPRAPRHGFTLGEADPGLAAAELTGWANDGMNVVAALGDETGVIGISGGAVLATWLTTQRPDAVSRLLVMSPFYSPASGKAPAFAIKPLTVLYGFGLLPDRGLAGTGQTLHGLTQYLRLAATLDEDAVNERLKSVAVVVALGDDQMDRGRAVDLPGRLAASNGVQSHVLTLSDAFGHDVVEPVAPGIREMYPTYLEFYNS